jgi:hypothetical protein
LFIPQIIYEYGEPRWKILTGKIEKLGEKPDPVPLSPS